MNINIVIPMAGLGSRFSEAGYEKPKPFIDVGGQPMIERVLENLHTSNARYILLVRDEHIKNYSSYINSIKKNYNSVIVPVTHLTKGTACTVLLAKKYILNQDPLVIANSDQIVDIRFNNFIEDALKRNLDGSILSFIDKEMNPKWSFAKVDKNDIVIEVKEKEAISNIATVGIYYFKRGSDFVEGATKMIARRDTVNGEYYTCPTYNYLIQNQLKIGIYNIHQNQMNGIGTPKDLKKYLKKIKSS